ncbi:MAG: DUF5926 family protein [Bifidobacteriaceae bacterium]|jgi:hypothetical protein|nr:DUF5926 family protein [Bifidobacteriaceae bacterium]
MADIDITRRPFAGLAGEADWVALSQVIPAGTATARFNTKNGGGDITVVTMLPRVRPAWKAADGTLFLALQTTYSSGDQSRDLAQALALAKDVDAGTPVESIDIQKEGPRLQDVLDTGAPFTVQVLGSFDYWEELSADSAEYRDAIDEAAKVLDETAAVPDVPGAYWTLQNGRPYLRWSLGLEEGPLFDALARLQAKREAGVVEDAKYAGAFRAAGLVIPVWQLPAGTTQDQLTEPLAAYKTKLDAALAAGPELDANARRARAGIVARSVTPR